MKAAEAARAAAESARIDALMSTPLWIHAIKCVATVALALWGSMLISQLFHKKADELVHKEVRSS